MAGQRDAPLTSVIVVACAAAYLVTSTGPSDWVYGVLVRYGVVPALVVRGYNVFSLFTYMFLHAGFGHLVTNMFVLVSVGKPLERRVGSARLGAVYAGAGVAGGLLHAAANPSSAVPVVGASGAIFGLIALLFLLMPFEITTALILPLPGVALGLLLLAVEVASLLVNASPDVAHDIHLYGFVAGSVGAFAIDYARALRGLVIAAMILLALYALGVYMNGYGF